MWREFAFEATVIQAKNLVWSDQNEYHTELGSICNTLKDFECSKYQFGQLVQRNPYNRTALANLGIAFANLEQWHQAKVKFESYFSVGGNASDVLYWYARSIESIEGLGSGVQWYYESLALGRKNEIALEALVSLLLQQRKFNEAASAIASVYQGALLDTSDAYELFEQSLNLWESHGFKENEEIVLPSFFENQVYSGIRLSANSRWRVAILNFEFQKIVVNRELINEAFLRTPADSKPQMSLQTPFGSFEVTPMEVPEIFVFGRAFKNVKVNICDDCPTIIGRPIIDAFQRTTVQRGSVQYITLKHSSTF